MRDKVFSALFTLVALLGLSAAVAGCNQSSHHKPAGGSPTTSFDSGTSFDAGVTFQ